MPDFGGARALIFDVDGTLYRLGPMRRRILGRLIRYGLKNPLAALETKRILSCYRRAHETLRMSNHLDKELGQAQLDLTSEWSGMPLPLVHATVNRWMREEPIAVLARHRRRGVLQLLEEAQKRGIAVAALSDYPAQDKLAALGVARYFNQVVCAQDPGVQQLKPHPRGLQVTLERLRMAPGESVYIGDRPEVDAVCAERVGVRCAVIGVEKEPRGNERWIAVKSFEELGEVLWPGSFFRSRSAEKMEAA